MHPLQVVYVTLFALSTAGCLWGAIRARSIDDGPVRRSLTVFLVLTSLWGITSAASLVTVSLPFLEGLYTVGLVVGFTTVVAWLWFCSAYAGHAYHHDRVIQAVALGGLAVIAGIKLTNPLHGWYLDPAVATEPFVHFAPEVGALYWAFAALAYVLSAIGLYLLFELYFDSQFNTSKVAVLTLVIALPIVPKLLALFWPKTLLLVFYEPIGAAVFAIGVVTVAEESFLAARTPARRQLADSLDDAIIVVDGRDRIADYNPAAVSLFPTLPEHTGDALESVAPAVVGESDRLLQFERDGEPRYYTLTTTSLTAGPTLVGHAYVLSDVTELETQRKRLQRQIEHSEGMTQAIAHELRNPLAIALGQLQLLRRSIDESSTGDEGAATDRDVDSIDSALSATARMESVIDDLLTVVKHNKPITDTAIQPLSDLLERASEDVPGVEVAVDADGKVEVEPHRAIELFRMLYDVHRDRGAGEIRARRVDDRVFVESDAAPFQVSDTEKLFEYGAEAGEDVRLQLANARTLATLHGWTLDVDQSAAELRFVLDGFGFPSSSP